MKRCPGCEREVDKVTFACEYCGRLIKENEKRQRLSREANKKVVKK